MQRKKGLEKRSHTGISGILLFIFVFFASAAVLALLALLTALPHSDTRHRQAVSSDIGNGAPVLNTLHLSDSFTMLIAVRNGDGTADELMLLRLDAARRRFSVFPVPTALSCRNSDFSDLTDAFKNGGIDIVRDSLEKQLSVKIDYRCRIPASSLVQLIGLFGGFEYDLPRDVDYRPSGENPLILRAGTQYLNGAKVSSLIGYSRQNNGYDIQAGLMKAFVGQKFTGRYLNNDSSFFKEIFDLIDTDFSLNDLLLRIGSIRQISSKPDFVYAISPAFQDIRSGETGLELDSKTQSLVKNAFS